MLGCTLALLCVVLHHFVFNSDQQVLSMIQNHHEGNGAEIICLKINILITVLKHSRFLKKRSGFASNTLTNIKNV